MGRHYKAPRKVSLRPVEADGALVPFLLEPSEPSGSTAWIWYPGLVSLEAC